MLKTPTLIFGFLCSVLSCFSQVAIEGRVTDRQGGLPSAKVLLLRSDSSQVSGVASDVNGKFIFEKVMPGQYIVASSMVGYVKSFSGLISVSDSNILLP